MPKLIDHRLNPSQIFIYKPQIEITFRNNQNVGSTGNRINCYIGAIRTRSFYTLKNRAGFTRP